MLLLLGELIIDLYYRSLLALRIFHVPFSLHMLIHWEGFGMKGLKIWTINICNSWTHIVWYLFFIKYLTLMSFGMVVFLENNIKILFLKERIFMLPNLLSHYIWTSCFLQLIHFQGLSMHSPLLMISHITLGFTFLSRKVRSLLF